MLTLWQRFFSCFFILRGMRFTSLIRYHNIPWQPAGCYVRAPFNKKKNLCSYNITVVTLLMNLIAFKYLHQQVRHVQEEKAQLEEEKAHMEEELHQQVSSILV